LSALGKCGIALTPARLPTASAFSISRPRFGALFTVAVMAAAYDNAPRPTQRASESDSATALC
jgi:hypothetical protein